MIVFIGPTKLSLIKGDLVRQDTDALVNAANSGLMGGGGVDGAIHRAGGPQILEECKQIRVKQGKCPTGGAVITGGGNLKAKYVIHAVGPVWQGGNKKEDELLKSAYFNSLQLAVEKGIKSLSFPSISTGAYGFPIERAARIALATIRNYPRLEGFEEIRMILYSDQDLKVYLTAWDEINK